MKITKLTGSTLVFIAILIGITTNANAQFLKKLGKAAERAAKETIENRVERETAEKTDAALDSVLEPGSKGKKPPSIPETIPNAETDTSDNDKETKIANTEKEPGLTIYSKFDFVPGEETIFYDGLEKDFVGDFPSNWDTDSNGEIVLIDGEKWFKLSPTSSYVPLLDKFPENCTIEFDVLTQGIDNKTSSTALFKLIFSDVQGLKKGKTYGFVELSPCQFIPSPGYLAKYINGSQDYFKPVGQDYRNHLNNKKARISIAVNQTRLRLWLNELKLVDIPSFLPDDGINGFKIYLTDAFRGENNKDQIFIRDLKISEAKMDLRKQLIQHGSVSTNGILFESGSATIQPQSMGVIHQIYQVLQQDGTMNLKIVGHTDADGDDATNMQLSQKRAESVKNALVSVYGIPTDRLKAEGMGETKPVADNTSSEGKAKNRRVEFIKT